MDIERHAKRISALMEILHDSDSSDSSKAKARFLIGARMHRMDLELGRIGEFIEEGEGK